MGEVDRSRALEKVRAPRPHEEAFYPQPVRPLFQSLSRLDELEENWREAADKTEEAWETYHRSTSEREALVRKMQAIRKQINSLSVSNESSRALRNQKVKIHNELVDRMNVLGGQADQAARSASHASSQFETWSVKSAQFRVTYRKEAERVGAHWGQLSQVRSWGASNPSVWQPHFLDRLGKHPLALHFAAESRATQGTVNEAGQREVVLREDGRGQYTIPVLLNGVVMDSMLIDTGASTCLIPEDVASAAGARRTGPPVSAKVADGRSVSIYPAVLDCVEIYGQRIGPVHVGILPNSENGDMTSLLGINVLSHIQIQFGPDRAVMLIQPTRERE